MMKSNTGSVRAPVSAASSHKPSYPPSGPCAKCDRTGRLVSYRYGVADCDACDGVGWLYPKAAPIAHAADVGTGLALESASKDCPATDD